MNDHDETETPVPNTSRLNFGSTLVAEPEAVTEQPQEEQPVDEPVENVAVDADASIEQPTEAVTEAEPVAPVSLADDPEFIAGLTGVEPEDQPEVVTETAAEEPAPTETETVEDVNLTVESITDEPLPEIHLEAPALAADERTTEDLTSERDRLDAAIAQRRSDEKTAVLDQIKGIVVIYGITTEEVVNALGGYKPKRVGVKAKTKYKDPTSGAVWSGRGKAPAWIKGQDYSKFLIPEAERV